MFVKMIDIIDKLASVIMRDEIISNIMFPSSYSTHFDLVLLTPWLTFSNDVTFIF